MEVLLVQSGTELEGLRSALVVLASQFDAIFKFKAEMEVFLVAQF